MTVAALDRQYRVSYPYQLTFGDGCHGSRSGERFGGVWTLLT